MDGGFGGNKAVTEGMLDYIFKSYVTRDVLADSSAKLKAVADTTDAAR